MRKNVAYGDYYLDFSGNLKKINKMTDISSVGVVYRGSYVGALKYFNIIEPEGKGDLMDIVIAHQLTDKFAIKTTFELFKILFRACDTQKYYIPFNYDLRIETIFGVLNKMDDKKLNFDQEIIDCLKSKITLKDHQKDRIYRLKCFYREYEEYIKFKTAIID